MLIRLTPLIAVLATATLSVSLNAQDRLEMFQTRHYEVHTDLDLDSARSLGTDMDTVHAAYAKRFSTFGVRNAKPMRLYLFDSRIS